MTQEVEVLVKMTFEADTELTTAQLRHKIQQWVCGAMMDKNATETGINFIYLGIAGIKEEAEIYGNR